MRLYGLIFLCLTISCVLSCTPEPIDIDIKSPTPKLVISSQIVPNRSFFVSVTRSFSALSNSTVDNNVSSRFLDRILVKNAFVTISYFNTVDTLFMVTPGIYSSNNTLQYDYGVYHLYVSDPESGEVVTSSIALQPQVLFDTIRPVLDINGVDTAVVINYGFNDKQGVDNWYVINYYVKQSDIDTSNLDIADYFIRGSNKLSEFELLSDKTFDNPKFSSRRVLKNISASDLIAVTLSNISEGYYRFLTTYQKSGNIINQISGEPITYPSNVKNGYGYFSAHNPDIRVFNLKDY